MKNYLKMAAFCLMVACATPLFTSCSDDSKEEVKNNADVTALKAELEACNTLIKAATTTDYPEKAIADFQETINLVETMLEGDPKQTAVDNMLTQLKEAKATFLKNAYDAIPLENLICDWSFDTEGENQVSTGTQDWTAVLKKGPSEIFGTNTDLPKFVDGVQGKALSFENGAHLEVSNFNKNTLLSNEMSISVWVNPSKTVAGNYIVSLNYWNTFKFQLQENNKPFFTFAGNNNTVSDCDNERDMSAVNGEWTHLTVVLSYKTKTLEFFVNGVSTKKWDADQKPALNATGWKTDWVSATGKALPLMIGAATTFEEASTWEWFKPEVVAAWDCFYGKMDELKIFNVALESGQIKKLYDDEKKK